MLTFIWFSIGWFAHHLKIFKNNTNQNIDDYEEIEEGSGANRENNLNQALKQMMSDMGMERPSMLVASALDDENESISYSLKESFSMSK